MKQGERPSPVLVAVTLFVLTILAVTLPALREH
jgi:hypothetical protein